MIIEIPKNDFINWIENDHKLALDVLHFVSNNMYKQAVKTGEGLAYPAICTLINYLINVFESENKEEVFIEDDGFDKFYNNLFPTTSNITIK